MNLPFNFTTIGSIVWSNMMATPNSRVERRAVVGPSQPTFGPSRTGNCRKDLHFQIPLLEGVRVGSIGKASTLFTAILVVTTAFLISTQVHRTCAATNRVSEAKTPLEYANQVYLTSLERYRNQATNSDSAWKYAAACFELAEFSTNDTQRATLAVEGINAMRALLSVETNCGPARYYLAMNLGQLARTKTLGALPIVSEMEREFKRAIEQDDRVDFAGPDRNLGQLYYRAPGWPASIGSQSKARKPLERAAEMFPNYPANRLILLEYYLTKRDRKGVVREARALEQLMTSERTNLAGVAWQSSWEDWDARWRTLKPKAEKLIGQ